MFTISNSRLSNTSLPFGTGAIIAVVDSPTPSSYAPLTAIASRREVEAIALPLPTYTGSTAQIDVGNLDLRGVESVEIAGVRYTAATTPNDIQPGQFFWNTYTDTVTVRLGSQNTPSSTAIAQPPAGATVRLLAAIGTPTDFVSPPYPAIFDLLPLEGTFQWSLGWEGHPSGQFTFRTFAFLKEQVIQALTPGTEFNAWGVGFRINNISITEIPASFQPLRVIQVNVPLGGRHENYVDRVVPLRQLNASGLEGIPDCIEGLSQAQQEAIGLLRQTSVAELAARAGDRFVGPSMPVPIPQDTPSTEGTTFISKAQEQVRLNGCFLRFSEPDAVKAISLNSVPTWKFQETDLRSQVSSTVAGRKKQPFLQFGIRNSEFGIGFHPQPLGTILPSTLIEPPQPTLKAENQSVYPYVHTYEPAYKLEGAFVEYLGLRSRTPRFSSSIPNSEFRIPNSEKTQGTASIYLTPSWKRKEPVRRETPEGDDHPELPPPNTGALKDLSNVFSQSGITKTYKVTRTEDDHPISEYQERWGFAFLAREMYQNQGDAKVLVGAVNKWRKIEEKRTTYYYDPYTGYLLGSTTTGWELIRFKEEDEQENTSTLDPSDADDQKKIPLYEYFQNPYRKEERHYLEPLSKYYKNTELPPTNFCKVLLPSGQYQLFGITDPNFVEPYFSKIGASYESNFKMMSDPTVDTDKPPKYLTTGKESYHRTIINLNGSRDRQTQGFGDYAVKEDSFNTYESQFSAQDALYANSLEQTTFKRDYGRPPVHTRKAAQYELLEPENQSGIPIQGQNQNNYFAFTQVGSEYSVDPTKVLASSLQGGSLSYPAAKTLQQAQTAAKTDLTIQNMKDCLQESFTIPFSPHVRDGDRLTYTCNGEVRQRRVLSISHEVEIKGLVDDVPIITSKGSQVSVGLERETPVQFKTESKPRLTIRQLYVPNTQTLGAVLDVKVETRRNF